MRRPRSDGPRSAGSDPRVTPRPSIPWQRTQLAANSCSPSSRADAPPAGRTHFLAMIGMAITPLFLAMIAMSSAGAVVFRGCVQS